MSYVKAIREANVKTAVARNEFYAKALEVETCELRGYLVLDGHTVKDWEIDQYSNLRCRVPKKFPVEYLPKFAAILEEERVEQVFPHRVTVGLFIEYYESHYRKITERELELMFRYDLRGKTASKSDSSFYEWLVGTSYSSDGNVPSNSPIKKSRIKELRATRGEEIGRELNVI